MQYYTAATRQIYPPFFHDSVEIILAKMTENPVLKEKQKRKKKLLYIEYFVCTSSCVYAQVHVYMHIRLSKSIYDHYTNDLIFFLLLDIRVRVKIVTE